MDAPRIVAVVAAGDEALERAVGRQSRPPASVVAASSVLAEGVPRALQAGAEWLWVLDGSALPRPDALARLVERLDPPADDLPRPVLLSSRVVDAAGVAAPGHAPWPRRMVTELTLRAAVHHLLPLRAARAGSLLVRAAAACPPAARLDGPGAALEWTARLLRDEVGYLVADSVADAAVPAPWPAAAAGRDAEEDLLVAVTMLAGGGWTGKERAALAAEAAARAAAALRARPADAPALVRAAARGLRAVLSPPAAAAGRRARRAAPSPRCPG